ncbi:MAG TPA: hypothetical protein VF950_28105 [Planctomycetota bacterium]
MDRLTCDRCGQGLLLDAPVRYEVTIEVKSAYDPLELVEEDLVDAADEMKRLIEKLKTLSPDDAQDEVYRKFSFDLCATCQKRFLKNPLSKPEPDRRNPEPDAPPEAR